MDLASRACELKYMMANRRQMCELKYMTARQLYSCCDGQYRLDYAVVTNEPPNLRA